MNMEYVLYLEKACGMWLRSNLGPMPENPRSLAEVLREAGIEVYMCRGDWVACEPRPTGIWEALTGKLADPNWVKGAALNAVQITEKLL